MRSIEKDTEKIPHKRCGQKGTEMDRNRGVCKAYMPVNILPNPGLAKSSNISKKSSRSSATA